MYQRGIDRYSEATPSSTNQTGGGFKADMYQNLVGYPLGRLMGNPNTRPGFRGEVHAPGHNFLGPGTNLPQRLARGDPPINGSDACARQHDIDYYQISNNRNRMSKDQLAMAVRSADQKFSGCLSQNTPSGVIDRLAGYASAQLFQGKAMLEDRGFMDPGLFISKKPEVGTSVVPGIIVPEEAAAEDEDGEQEGGSKFASGCCESCDKYNICEKLPGYKLKMNVFYPGVLDEEETA